MHCSKKEVFNKINVKNAIFIANTLGWCYSHVNHVVASSNNSQKVFIQKNEYATTSHTQIVFHSVKHVQSINAVGDEVQQWWQPSVVPSLKYSNKVRWGWEKIMNMEIILKSYIVLITYKMNVLGHYFNAKIFVFFNSVTGKSPIMPNWTI